MQYLLPTLLLVPAVLGATINPRQSTEAPISLQGDTSSFTNAAKYAQASYCTESAGGFINGATVSKVWGNGDSVPFCYVAYNPNSNQIIVAHEGWVSKLLFESTGTSLISFYFFCFRTDPTEIESLKVDADLFLDPMDSRFSSCGFKSGSEVHGGFQKAWASTADDILAEVNSQLASHSGASVLVTGHS